MRAEHFIDVSKAVKATEPDLAIVCVPHNAYWDILKVLAEHKTATLKEKPLAMNVDEARRIVDLYDKNSTYLQVCVQRRFSKLYDTTKQLINEIGAIYSVYIEYTMNLTAQDMASGWRADKTISGGGATIDMGYHIVDLLTYLFGTPDRLYAQLNYNSVGGDYTIDDTMKTLMTFNHNTNVNVVITKIFNQKNEKIRIFGDNGSVSLDGRKVTLFDKEKNELESYAFSSKDKEMDSQLDFFVKNHKNKKLIGKGNEFLGDQIQNTRVIDAIYKSDEEKRVITFEGVLG